MPSISLQFPLSTIMVMDNHVNGVPVAWYVASNEQESTIDQVLAAFKATVEAEDPVLPVLPPDSYGMPPRRILTPMPPHAGNVQRLVTIIMEERSWERPEALALFHLQPNRDFFLKAQDVKNLRCVRSHLHAHLPQKLL